MCIGVEKQCTQHYTSVWLCVVQWSIIWQRLQFRLAIQINQYCRNNVARCCPGAVNTNGYERRIIAQTNEYER